MGDKKTAQKHLRRYILLVKLFKVISKICE